VGCEPAPQPVELTRQQLEFESIEEYDGFFDGCVETLRLSGFELDRIDRRDGIITTFPVTSKHFFEFWRRDVDTRHDWFEASLLPLRRKVEVNLDRPEGGISGTLVVKVTRERLSAPDRQYNTSGAAFLVFSQGLPATTGKPIVPSRDEYWIADGRDGAMEARLLREMSGRPVVTDAEREPPVADESPESPASGAP
jgi:hypothetical protein